MFHFRVSQTLTNALLFSSPLRNIQRVIFYSTSKQGPHGPMDLDIPQVRQISGRAGRFKPAPTVPAAVVSEHPEDTEPSAAAAPEPAAQKQVVGMVTAMTSRDLKIVSNAFQATVPPLEKACIEPTEHLIYQFAVHLPPNTPFSYVLLRFFNTARLHPLFRLGMKDAAVAISDILQPVQGLSIKDRLTFVQAPVPSRNPSIIPILLELAQCIADRRPAPVLELKSLKLELLEYSGTATVGYLQQIEDLHKALVLYCWLSYRYEPLLQSRTTVFHIKSLVEKKIDQALLELGEAFRDRLARQMSARNKAAMRQAKRLGMQDPSAGPAEELLVGLAHDKSLAEASETDGDEGQQPPQGQDAPLVSPLEEDEDEEAPLEDNRTLKHETPLQEEARPSASANA